MAQATPSSLLLDSEPTGIGCQGLRRIAAALHHRDFRVLWFGACTSSIGTWMQSLAENWLVLSLTALGVLPGPRRVPAAAAHHALHADRRRRGRSPRSPADADGLAMGPAGHRRHAGRARLFPRRSRSGTSSLLSFHHRHRAQAFGGPAYQSLIPSLVGKQDLTNAIALNSIQFNVARMIGPLLAGATLAAFKRWGVEDMTAFAACFSLNALSFLVVIVALMSLHIKHLPAPRTAADDGRAARRVSRTCAKSAASWR